MLQARESTLNVPKPASVSPSSGFGPGLSPAMEQATLGATVVVKGEVRGSQPLYLDGRVEGSISFPNHRVTIGRGAVAVAKIEAKEVVIMGTVTGNIECSERVDIRSDAVLTGDVVTQRISIDEGAMVRGSVEIRKMGKSWENMGQAKPEVPAAKADAPAIPETSPKPLLPAVAPTKASSAVDTHETVRVAGSQVLYIEKKAGAQ